MKSQCGNHELLSIALAILICVLCTVGCNPRKTPTPVESSSKEQKPSGKTEPPIVKPDLQEQDSESEVAALHTEPGQEPSVAATEPAVPTAEMAAPESPSESWSVQRVIALAATGPVVVDLSVNIGGQSLDEAAEAATLRATTSITADMEKPWKWPALLDHPLVRSGWLGNLVPEADQRDELIKMYNSDGDEEVDEDELAAFLTRGLARGSAFRFSDIGSAPGAAASASPWEQLDTNRDSTLDKAEISNLQKVVRTFDLNADGIVTIAELQARRADTAPTAMRMTSMLDTKTGMAMATDQKPKLTARKILEHYTTLASVTREQWPGWNNEQWSSLDKDGDNQITRDEFEQFASAKAHVDVKIRFQVDSESTAVISANVQNENELQWASRLKAAGQVTGHSLALGINVVDSYTATSRASLRAQLANALSNPQVEMFLRNQLQLKEGAFDILDADQDDKLSDEEFEKAWDWVTAIRGSRILARWMLAESAWFGMADIDGDRRITEIEEQKLAGFLTGLDRDQDGAISPIEMPLAVQLEIVRTDDRFNVNSLVQPDQAEVERGWFAASDSNNDSFVNKSEFLGSAEDFLSYDADNDGFISASEAYKNPSGRVQ
jgi:Ca2+-binding EF-hand superfamily protein